MSLTLQASATHAEVEDLKASKLSSLARQPSSYVHKDHLTQTKDSLDLHGARNAAHAKEVFLSFMRTVLENNLSKVIVITGRGAHSNLKSGEYGVLSTSLPSWIEEEIWLKKKVKHCDLSSYGGRYTINLHINHKAAEGKPSSMSLEQHTKQREKDRKEAASQKQQFRKMKHKPNFREFY